MFERIGRRLDQKIWYIRVNIYCIIKYHKTYKEQDKIWYKEISELLKVKR